MRACTAAVVELAYRGAAAAPGDGASQCFDGAAPPRPYGCVVEMATAEFWAEEVGPYKAWLDAATRSSAAPPDGHGARAAYDRVVALFGADALGDAAAVYASKRGPGKGAKRRGAYFFEAHASVGATVTLEAGTAAELRAAAERYVDSSASAAEGALWPLVRRVAIAGPWASLACGLVLVDAPGLRDDNSARDGVVRQCLARADALLLVSNVRRAVNDKTVKDCLVAPFRARLARDRRPGDVVFVATQTDTMNRGEVAENLRLADDAPLEAVATARNDFCREAVDAAFYEGLDAAAGVLRTGDDVRELFAGETTNDDVLGRRRRSPRTAAPAASSSPCSPARRWTARSSRARGRRTARRRSGTTRARRRCPR